MENEKWTCAICGKRNTGNVCVQCNTPKGNEFKGKIEDLNTEESDIPLPDEKDKYENRNRRNTRDNNEAKPNNKNEIYTGIISVLFFVIVLLGFKIYSDSNDDKVLLHRETLPNPTIVVSEDNPQDSILSDHRESSSLTQTANKPALAEQADIMNAKNDNQKAAMRTFYDFHKKITEHNLGAAYDIFSPNLQSQISYEGWIPGFNTTVSSTPSEVKVLSESDYEITLTYYLQAVDNPGGIQNFVGTVILVKIGDSWKIDDIYNKIK